MIFTLIVIATLALFLGFWVLGPLVRSEPENLALEVSEDEAQFRDLIALRDGLLGRLLHAEVPQESGQPHYPSETQQAHASAREPEAPQAKVAQLSDEQALAALVGVCRVLRRLGLPYLPSGRNLGPLVMVLALLLGAFALRGVAAQAQPMAPGQDQSSTDAHASASAARSMPEPVLLPDGTSLGQVHQFVLSPDQGQMRVYYLALMSSPSGGRVRLRIPSPDHASDFDFSSLPQAKFEAVRASEPPVLDLTLEVGLNRIQGLFTIPATTGRAQWSSSFFQSLPGVTLIIMPEYHDVISKVFGDLPAAALGLWPPRFTTTPEGFDLSRTQEQPNDSDPNFRRLKNPPPQYSFQLFRRNFGDAPYPSFEVGGLAPSRTAGYLVVLTFGLVLASVTLARLRSAARLKQ